MSLNGLRIYKIWLRKWLIIHLILKNSTKISRYLYNLWMNISGKKWIVYQAKIFSIQSLLAWIRFKIDRIVCEWPNIAVTFSQPSNLFAKILYEIFGAKSKIWKLQKKWFVAVSLFKKLWALSVKKELIVILHLSSHVWNA